MSKDKKLSLWWGGAFAIVGVSVMGLSIVMLMGPWALLLVLGYLTLDFGRFLTRRDV